MRIWIDADKPLKTVQDCLNAITAYKYAIYSAHSHNCYWCGKQICDEKMLQYTVKDISIDEDGIARLWVDEL